jgi:hypothetical protein
MMIITVQTNHFDGIAQCYCTHKDRSFSHILPSCIPYQTLTSMNLPANINSFWLDLNYWCCMLLWDCNTVGWGSHGWSWAIVKAIIARHACMFAYIVILLFLPLSSLFVPHKLLRVRGNIPRALRTKNLLSPYPALQSKTKNRGVLIHQIKENVAGFLWEGRWSLRQCRSWLICNKGETVMVFFTFTELIGWKSCKLRFSECLEVACPCFQGACMTLVRDLEMLPPPSAAPLYHWNNCIFFV